MNRKDEFPCFSAVIFDLDGLVLDTEKTYFLAWKEAALAMGFILSDDFCSSLSGLHFQRVENKLSAQFGTDFDLSQFHHLSGHLWRQIVEKEGIPVKKGFYSCVDQLINNKIPFCLATNSEQVNAEECLSLAGLDQVFPHIICRDQVKQGKPSPDIFFAAAQAIQMPIEQCLVLEDSLTGIQSAVNAGAISVCIPSIHPVHSSIIELADYLLTDLEQVAEIIKNADSAAV